MISRFQIYKFSDLEMTEIKSYKYSLKEIKKLITFIKNFYYFTCNLFHFQIFLYTIYEL